MTPIQSRLGRRGPRTATSKSWFLRIRVHPLFIALFALSVMVGLWREMCLLFLLVMLHEMGHAMTAESLGYEVESVSLLPFGGVARLSYGNIGFRPKHEAAIAVAGPMVNLAIAGLGWGAWLFGLCSWEFMQMLVGLNAWIALFNLLPGLPLDGGRILRAARSRTIGFERATREAYNMAIGIAIALLGLGTAALWSGSPHVGMVILGLFLLVSAWSGRRDISMEVVRFLDFKKRAQYREPMPIQALMASSELTVRDVVRRFAPDRYHRVYITDDAGAVQVVMEERELLDAVFEGRWMETMNHWIPAD